MKIDGAVTNPPPIRFIREDLCSNEAKQLADQEIMIKDLREKIEKLVMVLERLGCPDRYKFGKFKEHPYHETHCPRCRALKDWIPFK